MGLQAAINECWSMKQNKMTDKEMEISVIYSWTKQEVKPAANVTRPSTKLVVVTEAELQLSESQQQTSPTAEP